MFGNSLTCLYNWMCNVNLNHSDGDRYEGEWRNDERVSPCDCLEVLIKVNLRRSMAEAS